MSSGQWTPGDRGTPTHRMRRTPSRRERACSAATPRPATRALKEELVKRFLPLARSLALRYRGASEQLEDLIQVASLGLVKALDGFDPERGRSFIAYAAPTILGELRRHFRDRVWELRLPRGLQERTMAVQEAAQKLGEELGPHPDRRPDRRATRALRGGGRRGPAGRGGTPHPVARRAPQPRRRGVGADGRDGGRPEPGYDRVEAQLAAEGAPLDERERTVLRLRFEEDLNQYEIGDRLGVSQMQVSRIMRRALRKLLEAVQAEERPSEQASELHQPVSPSPGAGVGAPQEVIR